jgi:hypothetical protein
MPHGCPRAGLIGHGVRRQHVPGKTGKTPSSSRTVDCRRSTAIERPLNVPAARAGACLLGELPLHCLKRDLLRQQNIASDHCAFGHKAPARNVPPRAVAGERSLPFPP